MQSLGVYYWYVKMPRVCGAWIIIYCIYVQKHVVPLVALLWFPAGLRWADRGARICETPLFRGDTWARSLVKLCKKVKYLCTRHGKNRWRFLNMYDVMQCLEVAGHTLVYYYHDENMFNSVGVIVRMDYSNSFPSQRNFH